MMEVPAQRSCAQLTAEIVSAFAANHQLDHSQLTKMIVDVHKALILAPRAAAKPKLQILVPAVPIKKSVLPDYIISLEDGRKFKSLKRHLRAYNDLSPDQYRMKWGLPKDYPMVVPNYAKARSALAKKIGLGRKSTVAVPVKRNTKKRRRPASSSSR